MENLLIIDDEKNILQLLSRILRLEGYSVLEAETIKKGRQLLEQEEVLVVLTDIRLPDGNGLALTQEIKQQYPEIEVICLTAFGNISDGVQAIKNGAFDYLQKADDNERIIPLVSKAVEKAKLQFKVKRLQEQLGKGYSFENIIGRAPAIRDAMHLAQKVAQTDTTVLLSGETGTGKEVFAQAIHAGSPRRAESFVAVNCSAFGKDILESELFGHRKGAFTGAATDKKGLFEEAHKGTIFLDEVGEMNPDLQAKLLRVLESGTFIKVGDTKETKVDVRVVAATNRNLEAEIQNNHFREDLFFRLSVFQIPLPSLNDRKEDIPLLAQHFLQQFNLKMNKSIQGMQADFLEALKQHHWKGNIRELRNIIERSVILCEQELLSPELLPFSFFSAVAGSVASSVFRLQDVERLHIQNVLNYAQGNKTQAAKLLDIGLTTLYAKIKEYDLKTE